MSDAFTSPASDRLDFDLRGRATTSNTLGLISVVMAVLGPCSSYLTLLFALPLALVAIHYARTVLSEDPDEVTAVYARTGMSMGVVSAVFSAVFLLFLAVFVLLYGAMIAAIIASGI